ncbi:hypothetical protein ES703_102707 [subsurface metagenome]
MTHQRDVGGAIRIVLNRYDLSRNTYLVVSLEVYNAVVPLLATPAMWRGDTPLVVATARLTQRLKQRFVGRRAGDLFIVEYLVGATSRCNGLVLLNS